MEQKKKASQNDLLFSEFKRPSYEEWKEEAVRLLKGKPFEKAMFTKTAEGITIKPIYRREDLDTLPHTNALPGYPPYVRGTKVDGDLVEPWICSQVVYKATPKAFNEALMDDLYRGQTALCFEVDENTLKGIDADDENATKLGYRGLSLSTLTDLETALHDVVIEVLPLHVNLGIDPVPLTALLGAYIKKHHINSLKVRGILGYDPLGYAAKHGTLDDNLDAAFNKMAAVIKWCQLEDNQLKTILVEGHAYHNGGLDSVQELAFMLATAAEYTQAMRDRKIEIKEIAKRMAFSVSVGSNFFMEISKLRAIKWLYAKLIEAFGGDEEDQKIYLHAKTSSWTKTVYDPYVNMLRNASEAFSAAVGNVDSMTIVPFDEPIREADDFSRRVSRNVQYFLIDEAHITQPIDPAGGSWYIESLTAEIVEMAWHKFQEIIKNGGIAEYLKNGNVSKIVSDKYETQFKDMAKRKHVWVGVNQYANMTEEKLTENMQNEDVKKSERINDVKNYRKDVNCEDLRSTLETLKANLSLNNAINAVLSGATLGDIKKAVRQDKDGFVAIPVVFKRGAERFEKLRDHTNEMTKNGKCPKVFSINMGPIPQHKARADFSRGFFEVGAFDVIGNDGFKTTDEAINATLNSGAHVGIICSTDKTYPELVPVIAKGIKQKMPQMILMLAGRPPKELESVYKEAGIDNFIYLGANCYDLLKSIQEEVENA